MGKENQCHRELVEDKGSRKQGTIIFSQNCFLGMQIGKQNVPEKLQQQFSDSRKQCFATNVAFRPKRRNTDGNNVSAKNGSTTMPSRLRGP